MRSIVLLALLPSALGAQSGSEIHQAVDRAIPPLERSTAAFVAKRTCVSCHHNILSILMFQMAKERSVSFDPAVLDAVEAKTFRSLRDPGAFDISIGGQAEDVDLIKRYQDLDVNRVSVSLPSEKADTILPVLDRWTTIIRTVNG